MQPKKGPAERSPVLLVQQTATSVLSERPSLELATFSLISRNSLEALHQKPTASFIDTFFTSFCHNNASELPCRCRSPTSQIPIYPFSLFTGSICSLFQTPTSLQSHSIWIPEAFCEETSWGQNAFRATWTKHTFVSNNRSRPGWLLHLADGTGTWEPVWEFDSLMESTIK